MHIDLLSPSSWVGGHPHAQYDWLRAHSPVHWHEEPDGPGFWAVTRYEDVRHVSRTPQTFSSEAGGVMIPDADDAGLAAQRLMMLNMDDPRHLRFRRLVSQPFLPRNIGLLTPRIHQLASEIVDDVSGRGACDFVADLAGRMPSSLVGELMGIPPDDAIRLYELTEIMHSTAEDDEARIRQIEAIMEMLEYAGATAARKRVEPGDDLMTQIVQAEVDGERLTDEEIQWFFLLLVNAGGDTTRNLLSAAVDLLFRNPDERQRLQADLDRLLPTAIEEFLRYASPVAHFRRTATHDTELAGQRIAAGEKVVVWYGAANFDSDVFDDPTRLDLGRDPNPHLAFGGGGPHLCLGVHLARLEIDAMLREVLTRLPDLEPDGPVELMQSNFIAGYHAMPVRFSAVP
ncbi:MAG: cytochrome P450 [Acidimicrobiia bacterium]